MAGRIAYYGGIVKDGLVLDLDAAKRDSYPGTGTTWRDISGNQNNGTLTNGPTFNSDNGGNIVFDGTNDYVQIGSSLIPSGNSSHTVFSWIYKKADNTGGGWIPLITWGKNINNQKRFIFLSSNSANSNRIYTGYYNNDNNWGVSIQNNVWVCLGWTFNGSSESIYINGVLFGSRSVSNVNTVTDANNFIGGYFDTSFIQYMNGNISSTQIYNRALTAQEVLQNYNATKGRYGL